MLNKINSPFTNNDFEIQNQEVIFNGFLRLVRYQLRYRLFDDSWSNAFTREVAERKSAIAILPYDPILDKVVLIEQFRPGAMSATNPWLIEIIAGLFEEDDTPADVALREAQEEAGCEILDLYPICEYFVSPGASNEYLWIYCGRIDATRVTDGIYGLKEENEDIRAFTLSLDDALAFLKEGKIQTAPAILSLQWLQINQNWLKQLWQTK
jgi:ADP-ribose pyrophosphatase